MEIGQRILGQIIVSTSIFFLSGALPVITEVPLLGGNVTSPSPRANSTSYEPSSLLPEMHPEDLSNDTLTPEAPDTKPTAGSFRSTLERILIFTGIPSNEDYDDYEDFDDKPETPFHSPTFAPPKPCDYDRCRHLQVACEELQRKQQCLCPGISGPAEQPDSPRIQDIHFSEDAISVHWCAPLSTVSEYRVLYWKVGEQDTRKSPSLNATFRMVTLSDLEPATSYMVCVEASNSAGTSLLSEENELYGSCKAIRTPGRRLLYLYVALAVAAALVLLVLAALGWYFWARKKKSILSGSVSNIAEMAGVPNPFYKSKSVEQL